MNTEAVVMLPAGPCVTCDGHTVFALYAPIPGGQGATRYWHHRQTVHVAGPSNAWACARDPRLVARPEATRELCPSYCGGDHSNPEPEPPLGERADYARWAREDEAYRLARQAAIGADVEQGAMPPSVMDTCSRSHYTTGAQAQAQLQQVADCASTGHDFRQYLYPDATDRGHPVPVLLFCAKCGDWREWTGWKAREDYR